MKFDAPEQWRRYQNTDYWISDQGRAKHVFKNGNEHLLEGYVLKGKNKQVVIKISGDTKKLKNVVWNLFRGEIPKGYYVTHKNGLFRDNSVYNLELTSWKECGYKFGGNSKKRKMVINLTTGRVYKSVRGASRKCYCSYQTITDACNKKTKNPSVNVAWWNGEKAYRGEYQYE